MALSVHHKASSSNSCKLNWKYHVFLSFRGCDSRKKFTDHLYVALCKKGFKAFRDSEALEKGEDLGNLFEAIEKSLFSIIVLSENYATSSWCLDELQMILDTRTEVGQVLPIFYDVDPSDVKNIRGSFAEALAKHEETYTKEKVKEWRDCLEKVGNISGWPSKNWHETVLIDIVVENLWSKLRSKLPPYKGTLIGIDSRINAIDSILGIGLDDVRFIGICGMGGIGKSTLAQVVYNRLRNQFETHCFLGKIREESKRYHDGQVHLQKKLLSCLNMKGIVIENEYEGREIIQNLFCNVKVLLVLDDVSCFDELNNLAGEPGWFNAGSRVIITTRDRHLLEAHGVYDIYDIEILNKEESLQLFCQKAFKRDEPEEGYLELSKSVVKYARGLPLALDVLGAFLSTRSSSKWKDALAKLEQAPKDDIHDILKISYDGLDDEENKTIFLDIACFFRGWEIDKVKDILINCGFHAEIGIEVLIEKSLLTTVIGSHGRKCIDMHGLIHQMGRRIVLQKCANNNIGKLCSRLWSPEDIDKVLNGNMEGTEEIEGVVLPFSFYSHEAYWHEEAFSKMLNLRLLIISRELNLPKGLKCLSSALKVLQWFKCPLEDLPLGAQLDELVFLEMHHSNLKRMWNGRQGLKSLKHMDLSHSKSFIETPNFCDVPNLETLILKGCTNLVEIHHSLGEHKNLCVVNLKGCTNLRTLPEKLDMNSLKELILCRCTQVTKLPEFGEKMKVLEKLDLQETSIEELPSSLGFLTGLQVLNLKGCKNLVRLPQYALKNLKHLKILDIYGCSKFSTLPENLNEVEGLEKLIASGTAISGIPSSIGHLQRLQVLSFHGCQGTSLKGLKLPPSIVNLESLTELDLSSCNIDEGVIPDDLGGLSLLRKLDLSRNKFVNLPARCISNLLQLQFLYFKFCPRLQSLPQPSPSLLQIDATACASMESLSCEKLWQLLASLNDTNGRHNARTGLKTELFVEQLKVTIPGNEIPCWFLDQNSLSLNDQRRMNSIVIDIPESCFASEWLCFALCQVLDTDENKCPLSYWTYECIKSCEEGEFVSLIGSHIQYDVEINSPHLGIVFVKICIVNDTNKEPSIDYNKLRLTFLPFKEVGLIKCGWRVIPKEDFEEWSKLSRSESHLLISEEHKNQECQRHRQLFPYHLCHHVVQIPNQLYLCTGKMKEMVDTLWNGHMENEFDNVDIDQFMRKVRDDFFEMDPQSWIDNAAVDVELDILFQAMISGNLDFDYLGEILQFFDDPLLESLDPSNHEIMKGITLQKLSSSQSSKFIDSIMDLSFFLEQVQGQPPKKRFPGVGRTLGSSSSNSDVSGNPNQATSYASNASSPSSMGLVDDERFPGVGRTLGSNSSISDKVGGDPNQATSSLGACASDNASLPSMGLVVDDSKPVTSIQLRLADGTRMVCRFNHHHTIRDVQAFINASKPGTPGNYQLLVMGFPPKPLLDLNQTIEQAGILNAVVVQKL